ncbi:MAG: sigma-70 family RNA polymerase sigma factor [Candidatus Poribacteria bacterium]
MLDELIEKSKLEREFASKVERSDIPRIGDDVELLLTHGYNEYNGFKIYLRQISPYPPLNCEDERELFRIFDRGSPRERIEARDRIILSNQWLIISVAKRFRGRGLELGDLVQEGNLGLIVAIEKFDYTKGFKFSTYAIHWIRQAIRRALYQKTHVVKRPEYLYSQINNLLRTRDRIQKFTGQGPSISELAEATGMSIAKIEQLYLLTQIEISLNQEIGDSNDGSNTIGDLLPDDKIAPTAEIVSEKVFGEQLAQLIDKSLEHLRPVEADVIRRRFGIGYDRRQTLETIGKAHRISKERIRQIESKALRELRHPSKGIPHPVKLGLDEPEDEISENNEKRQEQSNPRTINHSPYERCVVCNGKMPSDAWKYCSDLCRRKVIYEKKVGVNGGYIRQRREALGLYQHELADKIGVHVSTVRLWEANREKPNFENFNKLLDLFNGHQQQIRRRVNGRITGAYIKKQREIYGLTQKDLADRLGLTKETISSWERNVYAPDLRNQQRLRKLFAELAKAK